VTDGAVSTPDSDRGSIQSRYTQNHACQILPMELAYQEHQIYACELPHYVPDEFANFTIINISFEARK